ncbi:MAG: DUF4279 domain-containing protein [Rhodospirillaceae bacterium]
MLTLMIVGFKCDPARITEILGLTPTSTSVAGEISPRSGRPHRKSLWHISVGGDINSYLEHAVALRQILTLVEGKGEQFAAMRTEVQPEFTSISGGYYFTSDEQAGVGLECDEMRIMADCGIDWGVDIYSREMLDPPAGRYPS